MSLLTALSVMFRLLSSSCPCNFLYFLTSWCIIQSASYLPLGSYSIPTYSKSMCNLSALRIYCPDVLNLCHLLNPIFIAYILLYPLLISYRVLTFFVLYFPCFTPLPLSDTCLYFLPNRFSTLFFTSGLFDLPFGLSKFVD